MRHLGDADTAQHEAGGADTVEVHVACEVVSTGAQWLERRRQSRLELDERTDRTRSSVSSSRGPAMRSTRTTMRSERSRSSRISTKPAISTFQTGAESTGCAMIARLVVAVANPAARAAAPNAK
jgi:hypothetical protein